MMFVNEFVSEQDIEKYSLDSLWNRYNPYSEKMPALRLSGSYKHYWTIDRDQDIWLMLVEVVHSPEPECSRSGRPEPTGERIFILNVQNCHVEVRLFLSEDSTVSIYDVPYKRIWDLVSITPASLANVSQENLMTTFKAALTAFGDDGIKWQVPNTIVEFTF